MTFSSKQFGLHEEGGDELWAATAVDAFERLADGRRDGSERPRALLGGYAQTLEVPVAGWKVGSPADITKDFATAFFSAAVSMELRADVRCTSCVVRLEELALRERRGEPIDANDDDRLGTAPERGFAYAPNLLPAMDSPRWKSADGTRPRGPREASRSWHRMKTWQRPVGEP